MTEALLNEIHQTQLRLAQAANPIEQLEWATHLRELLAQRRKVLSGESRPEVGMPVFSDAELSMITHCRVPGAFIEVDGRNVSLLAFIVRRLVYHIEHFDAGGDTR